MPRISAARKTLEKLARKRSRGYPIATVAYYGPTDKFATKAAVGIVDEQEKVLALERWFSTTQDVRQDEGICQQIVGFIECHHAYRVAMVDRIIGCPPKISAPSAIRAPNPPPHTSTAVSGSSSGGG